MQRGEATSSAWILPASLLLAGWIYRDTYASVVETWHSNSTFSYGFLIVPISVWLAWRNRGALAGVPRSPSWLGVLLAGGCVAAWVVGRGAGVLGFEQAAAIALVPALVLATCGPRVVRVMAMPIAYLAFAIPIGHALVPWLMRATADVATWMLALTAVPVHRTDMYIQIPYGRFEVARACSGLNYVVTGLALGSLYSYLTYAGWRKRLLSMAAFVVVPVVANGLRVYFTILISYFTQMRFGPGTEHVWFGRAFFIGVMLAMFWIGRRWADDVPPVAAQQRTGLGPASSGAGGWLALATMAGLVLAGPPYLQSSLAAVEAQIARMGARVDLPAAADGWSGPVDAASAWRPLYSGARAEGRGRYSDTSGGQVDVFTAVYGLGASGGAEMISYQNRIFADERVVLRRDRARDVVLPGGGRLSVREIEVSDDGHPHRVWYWFMVGDRTLTSPYQVKVQEALAFLSRHAVPERVVTLATRDDDGAEARLAAFANAHALCIVRDAPSRACAP